MGYTFVSVVGDCLPEACNLNAVSEKRVIVNADDFGFSAGTTEGILHAHQHGIVTSTTIMSNMPCSEAAVQRLAEVPNLGVGVHLNAAQGRPLSPSGRALADSDGVLRHSAAGLILACCRRPKLLDVVQSEYEAQIRWVLDHGLKPTHLDSHRHAHGFTPLFRRVVSLARKYGIRYVRSYGEHLPRGGWARPALKQLLTARVLNGFGSVNRRIGADLCPTSGTWGIAHTGMLDAAWLCRVANTVGKGLTEIMTHPGFVDESAGASTRLVQSRQAELSALCESSVKIAFQEAGIRLTHYGEL